MASSVIKLNPSSTNNLKVLYNSPLEIINSIASTTPTSVKSATANSIKELKKQEDIQSAQVDATNYPHHAAIGAHLANFSYSLKSANVKHPINISPLQQQQSSYNTSLNWHTGEIYAYAQNLARELMEMPPNYCTPTYFTERAKKEFSGLDNIDLQIFDKEWAESMKMNSFLSVAQGSDEPCKFLQIKYNGAPDSNEKPLALVGKGITMDTGGISLKAGASMDLMRGDCGGACTLLATTQAIAKLKLPINVIFVAPLTENMPSGKATKPGDIITSMSGKTINVLNTDAEGRLVLADALYYISTKHDPHTIIDCATLTGAMVIALGEAYSGVFSTSDDLWNSLNQAGLDEDDKMWRMPFDDFYLKQINHTAADLANTGGRPGGACTAAIFLKQFVEGIEDSQGKESVRSYAHIDIAGSMECTKPDGPNVKGMSGRPTRTIIEFAGGVGASSPASTASTPMSSPTNSTPKRKRFIRKQPLKDRILQWPSNTLLKLYMDWDVAHMIDSPKVARPLGLLLHLLSFLVKYASITKQQKQSVLKKGTSAAYRASALRKSKMTVPWAPVLAVILLSATAINTYTLFTKYRAYRMFMRRDPLSSPNARKVQLDLNLDQSREGTPEIERRKTVGDSLVMVVGFVWKYFILLIWRPLLILIGIPLKKQDKNEALRDGQTEIYQIDMWDVNDGSLALFEIYSPAHALCWIFLNASNWIYLILIMVALWSQIHVMVDKYTQLLKDKLIVQGEVMHEYNESFVHPRVFKATRDASVQTEE
ncbi:hypothetical protein E3P92_03811 [Wallemia ichthyophaga]|uniref:Cytosol aminopeptidase domain-containing protein n=1 Tax=Wallemia ichthyophaga TaxID=245174 RepID=A0A4T0G1I8_WALIC|nr:hypothetical protein E3P95_03830 [Wallemia ichthyophaga]TIA96120.1 hypothetical protein E3P94_03825 [Wallemia ichthyophaga]TIB07696.1 hypothetical protein E3P93_03767 [Wallemia ichthyophaga]TIB08193.1 hypothetical protein E3P90_03777 [Wallemia ichthyophaga]TIB08298.1 hypothetical protein E3P92_03811 [Wallemia ichthyophaga]